MRAVLPTSAVLAILLAASAAAADTVPIHAALEQWLQLAQRDVRYLVVDADSSQVRLYHGGALLRRCAAKIVSAPRIGPDRAAAVPDRDSWSIVSPLRWARPAGPHATADPGPFDWERYLADAATDRSGLLLSDHGALYADARWQERLGEGVASIRLEARDLRALADALDEGTRLVYLAPGWSRAAP